MTKMSNPREVGDQPATLDRRSLLGRIAVGSAIAWVAPSIISVDAASAATCVTESTSWSSQQINIDALDTSSFTVGYGSGGVLTVEYDKTTAPAPPVAHAGYASVTPLGNQTADFITLEMDAATVGEETTLTFTFSDPVEFLTFSLLDVDLGLGNWQDEVDLTVTLAGVPVLLAPGDATFNPVFVDHTVVGTSDVFTGIFDPSGTGSGVPNNSTDANVLVTYPGLVDQVVITYVAAGGGPNPAPQQVGITDLIFCSTA